MSYSSNSPTQSYNNLRATKAYDEIIDISKQETDQTYRLKSASIPLAAIPKYVDTKNSMQVMPEYVVYRPFYTDEYMDRLANAHLFDDVLNAALNTLSYYVLGTTDEMKSVLYPEVIRPLKSELEAKNALKQLKIIKSGLDIAGNIINQQLNDQEIDAFEKYVHYTNKLAQLGKNLRQIFKSSHVFGRAGCAIDYTSVEIPDLGIPASSPIGLKPLKSMYLGNVVIDPLLGDIKALEYRDPTVKFKEYIDLGIKQYNANNNNTGITDVKYLDAQNCLYFVRNNNNMMREESDDYFGHSTLQSILPLSEENRRLNEVVLPQLNQAHWAGNIIWTFPSGYTERAQREFFDTMKPGGHTGITDDRIKFQEVKMTYDYNGLLNLKNELKKQMLSAFSIPSFLMNFENITNRATAETVVNGFNESIIQVERSWITDILDAQWFSKLFEAYWPDDEFVTTKMKIIMEFENVAFDSYLEKAVAVVSLRESGILTLTECRNKLNEAPLLPEDYAELGVTPPTDTFGPAQFEPITNPVSNAMMMNNAPVTTNTNSNTSGQQDTRSIASRQGRSAKLDLGKAGVGLSTQTSMSSIKHSLLSAMLRDRNGIYDSNY